MSRARRRAARCSTCSPTRVLPTQCVLTKADLASALELELAAAVAAARLRRLQRPFPFLVALSARTGEGVATLQHTLLMASGLLARPAPQAAARAR